MGRVNQAYTSQPSLRSKRFRLVSEHRKTDERDSRFWPREKWNESKKMKEGGGGGERRKKRPNNFSWSIITADESTKCRWTNSRMTDPSGWFSKSRGLYTSVSFLSSPPPPRCFTYTIFRTVFDSRPSFFAPKLHGNACYVGYSW